MHANLGTGYVTQQDLLEPLFAYFLYLSLFSSQYWKDVNLGHVCERTGLKHKEDVLV